MLLLLLAFAGFAPCAQLPLDAGATWTYRADLTWVRRGGRAAHRSIVWTARVLTVRATDSSVAAIVRGWPSDLAWWEPGRAPGRSAVYCVGGRVYLLRAPADSGAAFLTGLLDDTQRPDSADLILELPLHTGALFGRDPAKRRDTLYAWYVEGAEPVPPAVLRRRFGDAIRQSVIETLLRETWEAAREQDGLKPIADPQVRNVKFEDGAPLDPKRTLHVACNDFMATGGDDYSALRSERNRVFTDILVREALEQYISDRCKDGAALDVRTDDRIRRIGGGSAGR